MKRVVVKEGAQLSQELKGVIFKLEKLMEQRRSPFGIRVTRGYISDGIVISIKYFFARLIFGILHPADSKGKKELFQATLQEHREGRAMDVHIIDIKTVKGIIRKPCQSIFLSALFSQRIVHRYKHIFGELSFLLHAVGMRLSDDPREQLQIHVVADDKGDVA